MKAFVMAGKSQPADPRLVCSRLQSHVESLYLKKCAITIGTKLARAKNPSFQKYLRLDLDSK